MKNDKTKSKAMKIIEHLEKKDKKRAEFKVMVGAITNEQIT